MKQFTLKRAGTSVRLGQEIGRGGEGVVFAIECRSDCVAKIYSTKPDQRRIQKLAAMADAASPALLRISSWPTDLLVEGAGEVRGFVMPRIIARRDIHELYSPKSRSDAFPEADFRFLVHVGANIARAFAVIHEHGLVLGDVNHGNLLVGPDGTVVLIDCDSFQIGTGSDVFTCDVGIPLFTAPELQGRGFRNLLRTANHDLFGLAVLLFHLLYIGRHPFAGRYSGSGDMPIEKAIAEYRFAYGPDRASNGMERPPGTIPLETLGAEIAQQFAHAFSRSGRNGSRPVAKSWVAALWRSIVAIPVPGKDPVLPSERPWNVPAGVELPNRAMKHIRLILSAGLICGGLVACNAPITNGGMWTLASYALALLIWPWVSSKKRSADERAYAEADARWQAVLARWMSEASQEDFTTKLKDLESAHAQLVDMPNERRRRLANLEANREKLQRERYLDRFRIGWAQIPGIGPSRTSMLASYGIETANDIDGNKIKQIPGFGEVLTSALVAWRKEHEKNFRFNPNEHVDRRDIEAMDRALEAKRQTLQTALRQGSATLMRLNREIIAARPRLTPLLEKAWNNFKVAEAQRKAL